MLLSRLPMLEHTRLGGHTGGNLLLSMMEQYSGDFLAAVEGLRALLGCARARLAGERRVRQPVRANTATARTTRGEVEVDAGQTAGSAIKRLWLEPEVRLHPSVADAIPRFDAAIIGPGSFFTSLMPIFLVHGAPEAIQQVPGPVLRDEPADRGTRHVALHGGRSGPADERGHRAPDRRRHRQHRTSVGARALVAVPAGAQEAAGDRGHARDAARS